MVCPLVSLKGDHLKTNYIITITYGVNVTDGTDTIQCSVSASAVDPTTKERGDFIEYDDLTSCPDSLWTQIQAKFTDATYRQGLDNILADRKTSITEKDCSW